jgi:DDE superfamily endonuclease
MSTGTHATDRSITTRALNFPRSSWMFVNAVVPENLSLVSKSPAVCQPALSISTMPCAPGATACPSSAGNRFFLPPYSPELNPIERLWLHLRDNRLYAAAKERTSFGCG